VLLALREPSRLKLHYSGNEEFRLAVFILITMIPTGLIYLLFKETLENAFGDPRFVLGMLLVTGVLLILTKLRTNPDGPLTPTNSFLIGIAQGGALIPGISRSGSTICTGLYLNVTPEKAANFSFLMSLPVIVGATGIQVIKLFETGFTTPLLSILIGTAIAYASGVVAIKIVLDFVRRGNLQYFAYYCFLIGTIGLLII
jgi:undecaprenyl-diphosphatase